MVKRPEGRAPGKLRDARITYKINHFLLQKPSGVLIFSRLTTHRAVMKTNHTIEVRSTCQVSGTDEGFCKQRGDASLNP